MVIKPNLFAQKRCNPPFPCSHCPHAENLQKLLLLKDKTRFFRAKTRVRSFSQFSGYFTKFGVFKDARGAAHFAIF